MSATTKDELRQLLDLLSSHQIDAVLQFARFIRAQAAVDAAARSEDPMLARLSAAPDDDEPSSPEEDESARIARLEYERGDYLSAGDIKWRLLGQAGLPCAGSSTE